ncbi:alpha/beta hydrolase [Chitinophaga japonensis]|uniref:Phospholipase/carboxylesterase n=1 Tax=Chitinophaga japonensis TaxID=104662 RepID=A0A562T5E3_CHIJA|nr:dienelactone hydrolase family protein [Chitinophaga japonensis]TWI88474.1 phospholipase/carboxylesterase [Chitinophaga japonensis]
MHDKKIITAGKPLGEARKALIMIHGRGASADSILSLAAHLQVSDFALLAPQAANHTWYPYSFLAPPAQNEPWLSSALSVLKEVTDDIQKAGIPAEHIYFLGFSQGACLMLEFIARNAAQYGGAAAFTGGLVGDKIYPENYKGDFNGTPIFIGTSDPDMHVPVERVYATTNILKNMGASVTEKVYPNMGHTINQDEIDLANKLVFRP